MQIPFNLNRMKDTELHFPQRFASMLQKDYGLIFFNEGNKASLDSNHAVIKDHLGIESSLRDIEFFYKSKGINPSIYSSLQAGELSRISDALEHHGFTVQFLDHEYFVHDHDGILKPIDELKIERVQKLDIEIMETLALEYGGDWTIKVAERHLAHPSYHLLGGFYAGELAALASVSIYAGYSRVADVFTRDKFRGKGFAGSMIHYLVNYHHGISPNHLYLVSDNPGTTRIYEKGGFSRVNQDFQTWMAMKKL
ncbi:MAG: GNAT family N-acetyltransferase [Candidatus Cloacimonetes bacterium]|nr:GNAT family N-acetyltransferase [Candidatus Cloacimonadota bacterium]MDD3578617.1 GNAT family N-acetyltransferase [Candidatus Cloacimonadota bacterium]